MLVVRGTKKFLDRVGKPAAGDAESSTVLGDWYATVLFWRPQAAMFVNEQTLFPVLVPLAPAAGVVTRFRGRLRSVLLDQGFGSGLIEAELKAMEQHVLGRTRSRSVLGVMNEFKHMAEAYRLEAPEPDLGALADWLASSPCGPLSFGTPEEALRSLAGPSAARPAAPKRPIQPKAGRVYQLKVTIRGTDPAVWRRVVLHDRSTLAELHRVLQAALGWWDYHLHEFEIDGARYGIADGDGWDPPKDERRERLDGLLRESSRFVYVYDFGDHWQHDIEVEGIGDADPAARYPACIDGARACPPEDCGGPHGYAEFLEAIANPHHPEHKSSLSWAGGRFDPEAFEPDASERSPHLRSRRR